jgi:hypothetical protein
VIEFIVLYQATIRECINGVGMVLCLTLATMISIFLWDSWVSSSDGKNWIGIPGVPTACSLWWVFTAETYRTGAIWWLYNVGKHHHRDVDFGVGVFNEAGFFATFGYLIAGVMLCGGLLRAIYIFSPPTWKRRVWVYAALASIAFILSPTVYHFTLEGSHGF